MTSLINATFEGKTLLIKHNEMKENKLNQDVEEEEKKEGSFPQIKDLKNGPKTNKKKELSQ